MDINYTSMWQYAEYAKAWIQKILSEGFKGFFVVFLKGAEEYRTNSKSGPS